MKSKLGTLPEGFSCTHFPQKFSDCVSSKMLLLWVGGSGVGSFCSKKNACVNSLSPVCSVWPSSHKTFFSKILSSTGTSSQSLQLIPEFSNKMLQTLWVVRWCIVATTLSQILGGFLFFSPPFAIWAKIWSGFLRVFFPCYNASSPLLWKLPNLLHRVCLFVCFQNILLWVL